MTASTGESRDREQARGAPDINTRGLIPADTFANRLLLVRKMLGLTQREAAEQAGLNYGSWSNWENGMKPADAFGVIDAICGSFGIDREWLTFGGALLGARGRPVKRTGADPTADKGRVPEWARGTRPVGRPDLGRLAPQGGASRSTKGRPVDSVRRASRTGNRPLTQGVPGADAEALLAA